MNLSKGTFFSELVHTSTVWHMPSKPTYPHLRKNKRCPPELKFAYTKDMHETDLIRRDLRQDSDSLLRRLYSTSRNKSGARFLENFFTNDPQIDCSIAHSLISRNLQNVLLAELERYTRQTTWFWVFLFASMGVMSILLAVFASHEWWSLFTNLISYLLVGAAFAVEFALRRVLFPHLPHTGLVDYIQALMKTDFRRP